MNKELEKIIDKNKDSFSKKSYNISKIEQKIDDIVLEHKDKIDRSPVRKSDLEKISLRSKNGKHLYYLKKKKDKREEALSGEIINKARKNLGEKPIKVKKQKEKPEPIKKNELKKKIKSKTSKTKSSKTRNKTKDFNELTENIDKVLTSKNNDLIEIVKTEESKTKFEDEKVEQSPETIDEKQEIIDISEVKAKQFAESHIEQTEKESKLEAKKKFEEDDLKKIPNIDTSTAEIDTFENDERQFLDKKIGSENINVEPIKSSEEFEKEKRSMFGWKAKKQEKQERIEKEIEPKSEPTIAPIKHTFKVDNLPESEKTKDEINLIDKTLTENSLSNSNEKDIDLSEIQAQELAKKHLKDSFSNKDPDSFSKTKKSSDDANIPITFDSSSSDKNHEFVFFDEHNSSDGWSPHISEKDRRELSLPISGKSEITPENLKATKDIELPKEVLNVKSVKLSDLGFSENDWEELDFYALAEPFVFVEILREKDTLEKCYFLVEMSLTKKEQKILDFIQETMRRSAFDTEEMEAEGDKDYLENSINKIINEYNINIDKVTKHKLLYYIGRISLGLGKIDALMQDPNIEDISCDGSGVPIFLYHRVYGSLKSNIKFNDEDELSSFIFRLAQKCGKHISIAEPMLDATMPDGSRIQMTLSDEITAKGSTFTIRKFKDDPFSPPDLFEYNTMSSEMIAYLWIAVENGINTLFAGGTASGKTTALNAVSLFIPAESKIVSIEETREINLPHTNWIPGVARTGFGSVVVADKIQGEIDMYDLMKAALRQRPEYILVGEIRGREAYVLFQAMATGHATYSTVHADSAQSLIHRLEGKPINIPRVMLQSLDVISLHIITKVKNTRARRCKQIVEIIDIDPTTKEILTNEVFRWDPVEDKFIYSGKSYVLEKIRAEKDLSRENMTQELKKRQTIIEWMNNNNIRQFREVTNIVTRYAESPDEVLKEINK